MADIDKPRIEDLGDKRAFLDALRRHWGPTGLDLGQVLADLVQPETEKQLESSGARTDFDKLCGCGCMLQIWSVIVAMARFAANLENSVD
jgi:hypothetical protein